VWTRLFIYALKNKPSKIENRKNSDRHAATATAENARKVRRGRGCQIFEQAF
jgi:hypothetical protein